MTVQTTYAPVQYAGNGTTAAFPFTAPFFAAADLVVLLYDSGTRVTTTCALNGAGATGYEVAGTQDSATGEYIAGGWVVMNTAPSITQTLTIQRSVAATQPLALANNAPFPAKSIEAALDRMTLLLQQVLALLGFAVSAPATDGVGIAALPAKALRANQMLGFDGNGNPIAAQPSSALISTVMQPVASAATLAAAAAAMGVAANVAIIANLRDLTGTAPAVVHVEGYNDVGDGGGGVFWLDVADATSADDGGTIIVDAANRRWYLQHDGSVSIRQFGAKIDGTTNDAAAIAAAIAAAAARKFTVTCPAGTSVLGSTTLAFPATIPEGFQFLCHPDFTLSFSGTSGSAVTIDSCYHARFRFGRITGAGGTSYGLHVVPIAQGANGQVTVVVSEIDFVFIGGFEAPLYLDCYAGSIAQTNIRGLEIDSGFGVGAGTMTGNVYGIVVNGASPNIFQGNVVEVNYIQSGAAALGAGATWIGIQDGGTTFGPTLDNVNQYRFGAIDGGGFATSVGVNTFAGYNVFAGPIVDVATGAQFESGVVAIALYSADINVLAGGTRVSNLSNAIGTYVLNGPQGWQAGAGYTGIPNGTVVQHGTVTLTASPTTFSFPEAFSTDSTPVIVGSLGNNTTASLGVDVSVTTDSQFIVHGPTGEVISWIAIGSGKVT